MTGKGDLSVGMDADIAIWDINHKWTISAKDLHHNVDYTPFEDFTGIGKTYNCFVRGKIIIENDELKITPGHGLFVKRDVSLSAF